MADLDNDLSRRLSRLAAAVPTARLDPAHLRAVEARHRVRMSWVTPLVALVVIVVGATLIGGGNEPGATSKPGASTLHGPIEATDTRGAFSLTIRSSKPVYRSGDPIDVAASLSFAGPDSSVRITHGLGVDRGPLGFGVVEPVDVPGVGLIQLGGGYRLACVTTTFHRDLPIEAPFSKGGSPLLDPPEGPTFEELQAYMSDRVLRLPSGTWHIFAIAEFATGDCGRGGVESVRYSLRAEIVVVVADDPAATAGPPQPTRFLNQPVYGGDDIGDFTMQLKAGHSTYAAGEPIDVSAWYTFGSGIGSSVTVSHFGPEMAFSISQVADDAEVIRSLVYDSTCQEALLVDGKDRHVALIDDNVLTIEAATWPPSTADALKGGILQLPVGRWVISVVVETSLGPCGAQGESRRLHASIEIAVVGPATGEISTPGAGGHGPDRWISSVTKGDFELSLQAAKPTFLSDQPLDVTASLTYRGSEDRFSIGHAILGPIEFTMPGSGATVVPAGPRSCAEIDLARNVAFPVRLVALGEPLGPFNVAHGLYEISALADFRIGGCDAPRASIGTSIVVAVVDGPDDIPLFTNHSQGGACLLLRNGGQLATSDTGLGVMKLDGRLREVIWPAGYSARHSPEGALLIGADGQVVARVGDQVAFDAFDPDEGPLHPCGEVDPDPQVIELRTAAQPTDECPMARGGGTLSWHPESGLGVRRLLDDVMAVTWPFGYTARRDATGAILLDTEGRVVAGEGDQVSFGGAFLGNGGFYACTGVEVSTP